MSPPVVYRGETIITEFDPDRLGELDDILEDFVELDEGEQLFVSPRADGALEVSKLRQESKEEGPPG